MNKQELIEKINNLSYILTWNRPRINREIVIDLIEQLDEPQKPVVPQFVAGKIEYFKKTGDWDLFQAMDYSFGEKDIREWLEVKNNQEIFARAWLDGYEIEREKRYFVSIKGMSTTNFLNREVINGIWYMGNIVDLEPFTSRHTRKELEQGGFGWVFDCPGIEIEEVEE